MFTTLSMYHWLTVSSPREETFSLWSSRPIGNMRTHRMWVETIFGGLLCRRFLTLACLPRARPFSLWPTTSKRLLRRPPKLILVKCTQILESGNFLLVESGIQGFGIQNRAQVLRNPTKKWNPESTFHWKRLESSTLWNPESMEWDPESKTVLYFLIWGDST